MTLEFQWALVLQVSAAVFLLMQVIQVIRIQEQVVVLKSLVAPVQQQQVVTLILQLQTVAHMGPWDVL